MAFFCMFFFFVFLEKLPRHARKMPRSCSWAGDDLCTHCICSCGWKIAVITNETRFGLCFGFSFAYALGFGFGFGDGDGVSQAMDFVTGGCLVIIYEANGAICSQVGTVTQSVKLNNCVSLNAVCYLHRFPPHCKQSAKQFGINVIGSNCLVFGWMGR